MIRSVGRFGILTWVAWVVGGCGASLPTRAIRLDDAIRSSVCEAVMAADETGTSISELSIELGVTMGVSVEAGVEAGPLSVSATGSFESSSTIGITINEDDLPTPSACLEIQSREIDVFEINRDGEAHLTSSVEAPTPSPASAPVTNEPLACDPTTVAAWGRYGSVEGAREQCVATAPVESRVQRRRRDGDSIRWAVISRTSRDGVECVCQPQ